MSLSQGPSEAKKGYLTAAPDSNSLYCFQYSVKRQALHNYVCFRGFLLSEDQQECD